jgi:hypothetical protein
MNRRLLGLGCGVAFGTCDVLLTVFGNHPDVSHAMLLQAFTSRLAIGVLAANVSLGMDQILAGALTGLLISLPDAFALHSYIGVLGTGVVFGAIAGWAAKKWAK